MSRRSAQVPQEEVQKGSEHAEVLVERFDQLPLSAESQRAIAEGFGFVSMTDVQARTVVPLLNGMDVVAKAKTGTGKTLGFLVPTVERIRESAGDEDTAAIHALIISPVRELASQIENEAATLVKFHRGLTSACVFGGKKISRDQKSPAFGSCRILIATPGRLQDHLANTPGFASRLRNVQVLILDEADRLLDMGFRKNILQIIEHLPPASKRQSMLFSATFPPKVQEVAGLVLRPGYQYVDTIPKEDEDTPDKIAQSYSVVATEDMISALWATLFAACASDPQSHKVIVFLPTAWVTAYHAALFRESGIDSSIMELHSRKSQGFRTKESEKFRLAKRGILFTSDVSARGLDYPGVTLVIQAGAASDRDQYVHRLGRTGRGGQRGEGLLLLPDFERGFLRRLADLQLREVQPPRAPFPGLPAVEQRLVEKAYGSWLGCYASRMPKQAAVDEAFRFAKSMGAIGPDQLPPPIRKKTVGKMGMKGIPGLNVVM